jgi:hypothetical protein
LFSHVKSEALSFLAPKPQNTSPVLGVPGYEEKVRCICTLQMLEDPLFLRKVHQPVTKAIHESLDDT